MKLSALITPLLEARVAPEQILAVVLAYEAQQNEASDKAEAILEQRRATARARLRRWRERQRGNVTQHDETLSNGLARAVERNSNTQKEPQVNDVREAPFERFWLAFPNKVGKPRARTAFRAALAKADLPTILSGIERYIAGKPPDRQWLNPASFLNQERWADLPAAAGSPAASPPPRAAAQPNPVRAVIAGLREQAHERVREAGSDRPPAVGLSGRR